MEKFANITINLYQLACFILWAYMVYLMSKQYIDNKDSSQLAYKKFESSDNGYDTYPTFSICTLGADGSIFYPLVDTELYNELYDHPECQKPKTTHPSCEISLYQRMLLGRQEITPNASAQNVDGITRSVLDLMKRFNFNETGGKWYLSPKKSMYVSYQDSLRKCFTKETEPGMGTNHTYDLYGIAADRLQNLKLPLEIYIHKVGGLIEQLGKQYILHISPAEVKQLNENYKKTSENHDTEHGITVFHDFHLKQIEILRKRHDAAKACNNSIHDNDKIYKDSLMMSVGCVPSYWKRFVTAAISHLPNCSKKSQFEQLANMLPSMYENTNLRNGRKLYIQPCAKMKILTITNKRDVHSKGHKLWLSFYYDADEYKEILNNQAFTTNDLWSQIGGIVGIFLGYSCLQVLLLHNTFIYIWFLFIFVWIPIFGF